MVRAGSGGEGGGGQNHCAEAGILNVLLSESTRQATQRPRRKSIIEL